MSKIKFVYFDVGGVLEKDFSESNKWIKLKEYIGVRPDKVAEFDQLFSYFEHKVCLGMELNDLTSTFAERLSIKFSDDFDFLQYFIDHFEKNDDIFPVLDAITVPKGLLTNMYPRMLDLIIKKGLIPSSGWKYIFDSSVIKLSKPDYQIYQIAKEATGFEYEEILFIDNSKDNINTAIELGMNTFFFDSKDYKRSSTLLLDYIKANI